MAGQVGVNFNHRSKIECGKLDFGDHPGEGLIVKLAEGLETKEDELLLLAEKIPDRIRRRVIERPDAFRQLALLDDEPLDRLLTLLDR